MLDGIMFMVLVGFLALVVYATVWKAPPRPVPAAEPPPPPAPLDILCSICGRSAGRVSEEGWLGMLRQGVRMHCGRCRPVVEAYERELESRRAPGA